MGTSSSRNAKIQTVIGKIVVLKKKSFSVKTLVEKCPENFISVVHPRRLKCGMKKWTLKSLDLSRS